MSREAILRHLVDTVAETGTGGLSVRAVATRAGVAIGTVQHHFPTRSAMLLAAMDTIVEHAAAVQPAGLGPDDPGPDEPDPAARLHLVVSVLVPSGPDSTAGRVWLAFAAQAVVDPALATRYQELWGRTRAGLADRLARAAPQAPRPAVDDAATELLALLDGLAVAVLAEPNRLTTDAARAIARRRVDELLTTLRG